MHREGADREVERRVVEWHPGHVSDQELGTGLTGAEGVSGLVARAPDLVRIHVDGGDRQPVEGRQADRQRSRAAANLEDRGAGRRSPGDVLGDRPESEFSYQPIVRTG